MDTSGRIRTNCKMYLSLLSTDTGSLIQFKLQGFYMVDGKKPLLMIYTVFSKLCAFCTDMSLPQQHNKLCQYYLYEILLDYLKHPNAQSKKNTSFLFTFPSSKIDTHQMTFFRKEH